MAYLKIQDSKINIENVCDFLVSESEQDLFIQIEMNDCTYKKLEYKKGEMEKFKGDVQRVEKILIKKCNIKDYNERKCQLN